MDKRAPILDSFATFGDFLKFLRRRAQLTQQELAIAVGYSEAQISRLENKQRPPETARLAALFVPVLHLENEPEMVRLLLDLAEKARGKMARPWAAEAQGSAAWTEDRKTNLPAPLSSFIGREQEISEVSQSVFQHRLVTLTGAGGVGKTRLAMRAAEEMLEYFMDGVWLVNLAQLSDPALVVRAVAGALEVRELPGQPLHQTLVRILRARNLLLILDNCEQVIDEAARLAVLLLEGCAHLHILATSRENLRVEGGLLSAVLHFLCQDRRATADTARRI